MLSRRSLLAAALAAPALLPRAALGQTLGQTRNVKIGSAFTTTTNAAFLMPKYLKEAGVEAELVLFPSLVQRMQAVASGDVQVGNGGLSATMQVDTKGFPMAVLANGCDGGWALLARPDIKSFAELKGKKIAVQQGSIGLVSLLWKLKAESMDGGVELVYLDNDKQPIPLSRGDVDAICCFEPYAGFAKVNGWGKVIWDVYETPMGKTNLGFVASQAFVTAEPDLTKLLVAAHVKATNEVKNNPAIALETTMKQFKMPRNIAEVSNSNLFFSAASGQPFQDGLKNLAKMMIGNKLLDKEPDWDRFINAKFL
jgi:NitT/TauT family transport system substrate-binding protein